MLLPQLLLLVPLLLVEAQNNPQNEFRLSERLPLRRPVITPGFRPGATSDGPPASYTPVTTKRVPEQSIPTSAKDKVLFKTAHSANAPVSKTPEPETKKPGFTIIFTDDDTKKPTTLPSVPSTVTRQPFQRPFTPKLTTIAPSSTVNQITRLPSQLSPKPAVLQPEKAKESYTIFIVKNENSKSEPTTATEAPPTEVPASTTYKRPSTATTSNPPIVTVVTEAPTTRPNLSKKTTEPTKRPVIWRFPTGPSSAAPIQTLTTKITTQPAVEISPTTPAIQPRPTPPAIQPRPTPPAIQPRPTPPAIQPRPTPPAIQPRPTPPAIQPRPTPPETNIISQLNDHNCKNENGYYSVPNKCDEYILCKNNIAYLSICPDGLHFDYATHWPSYPCAYPSEVKCQDHTTKQQAQPTSECPHRYGYFAIPESDCGHYIVCQEGKATIMPCPAGLVFNEQTSSCDWPANVPGCNPSVFHGFTCPAKSLDNFGNSLITNYRYQDSCKNYIACHEGHPRLLSCDPGLSFDDNTAKCVDSSLISNCNNYTD